MRLKGWFKKAKRKWFFENIISFEFFFYDACRNNRAFEYYNGSFYKGGLDNDYCVLVHKKYKKLKPFELFFLLRKEYKQRDWNKNRFVFWYKTFKQLEIQARTPGVTVGDDG